LLMLQILLSSSEAKRPNVLARSNIYKNFLRDSFHTFFCNIVLKKIWIYTTLLCQVYLTFISINLDYYDELSRIFSKIIYEKNLTIIFEL